MKPKVAFFDFASCEGCQLTVLNCEDVFLALMDLVDLVEFREALSEKAPRYDIAFVEGSINRESDADRIREIRARSRYVVSLGACACNGNVQARANFTAPAENFKRVYGEEARNRVQTDPEHWPLWSHTRVRPLKDIIAIDYELRGCPIMPSEFLHVVKSLLAGSIPRFVPNSVCVECKMAENECVYDRNDACLGQITYGGCEAVCVSGGYRCDGCRGLLPHANLDAHGRVMLAAGLSETQIENRYRLFLSHEMEKRGRRS